MKKIVFIIAALTLITASCVSQEIDTEEQSLPLKFKISTDVLGKGVATKTNKTSWEAGDVLNIWFDTYKNDSSAEPDAVLEYSGSGDDWNVIQVREHLSIPASGGKMLAVYMRENFFSYYKQDTYKEFVFPLAKIGSLLSEDVYCASLTCYTDDPVAYSYSAGTNTVTVHLTGWKFLTPFKVLVKDDPGLQEYGDSHDMAVAATTSPGALKGFKITCDTFKVVPLASDSDYTGGIREGEGVSDGVAFYFSSFHSANNSNVVFYFQMADGDGLVPGLHSFNKYNTDGDITAANTTCQEIDVYLDSFTSPVP